MAKIKNIKEVAVKDLHPYDRNSKIHNEDQIWKIGESIQKFGFLNPCLIDKDNNIIAGHGRVLAAEHIGMETVPCIYIEGLTEEERRAYVIADNRLSELAEWDQDMLASELEELSEAGFDIEITGFTLDDISNGIPELSDDDFDFDDAAAAIKEPTAQRGQIYQLGDHRLMCGDSTKVDDVKKLMGDDIADLVVTDPPYNVDYTGGTKDALKIENESMSPEEFRKFLRNAFSAMSSVMKEGAGFYVWYAAREHINFESALLEVGMTVREQLIWVKNSLVLGRQDYQWKHEPCLYGWKDGASHYFTDDRNETTVINEDKPSQSEIHPTMKPVPLFGRLIKNSTKRGWVVLDIFGGSGTTIMACEQLGRKARVMEYDPKYVDAIIQRFEEETGKKAKLING